MNARVRVTISNDRVPHIGSRLRQRVGVINQQHAKRVEGEAKRRVHVITGTLRDGIKAEKGGVLAWSVSAGTPERDYWDAIAEEYGTSVRPPHPFLRPAVEATSGHYWRLMDKALDDVVRQR